MTNKIMLVDSYNLNLENTLELGGYTICIASDDVVSSALKEAPDLILLGYGKVGLNACEDLRNDNRTKDIPLIATGSKKQRCRYSTLTALGSGCIDFIDNIDTDENILDRLNNYLRLSRIRNICNTIASKLA